MSDTEISHAIFKIFTVLPLRLDQMDLYVPLDKFRGVAENEPLGVVEKIAKV